MQEPSWVKNSANKEWQKILRAKCFDRMNAHRKSKAQSFCQNICDRCRQIDFEYLFFGNPDTGFRNEEESRVGVGWLPDILRTKCELCEQFAKSAKQCIPQAEGLAGMMLGYTEPGEKVDMESVYVVLVAADDMWAKDPRFIPETEIDINYSTVTMHLVMRRCNDRGLSYSQHSIGSVDLQLENHRLSRWLLLADVADLGMCKKWLDVCSENHKICIQGRKDFGLPVKPSGLVFRLVDVTKNQIVEFQGIPELSYAIMSYVCGNKKPDWDLAHDSIAWIEDGEGSRIRPLPHNIPLSIVDTMAVTKALELQYLWVDSLCILQEDPVDLARQIGVMNIIYTMATLCIVDASGRDPMGGLSGMTKPRPKQETCAAHVKEVLTIGWPQRKPLSAILSPCAWVSRAWCYQEIILSTRSLLFTENEVFFYCAETTYRESCKVSLPRSTTSRKARGHWLPSELSGNLNIMRINRDSPHTVRSRSKIYKEVVQGYCGRDLSKQSDALNAFQGLSNFMEKLLGMRMIYGMAEAMFVDSLRWEPQNPRQSDLQRRSEQVTAGGRCEEQSRPLYPSWSWLSRKDKITFRDGELTYYQPYRPDTVMRVLHQAAVPSIPATPETEYSFLTACEKGLDGQQQRTVQGIIPVLTKFAEFEIWCYDTSDNIEEDFPVNWTVRRADFHMDIGHIRGDTLPRRPGRRIGTFLQIWSRPSGISSGHVEVLLVNKFEFPTIHGLPGEAYTKEMFEQKKLKKFAEILTAQNWEGVDQSWIKEANQHDFDERLKILPLHLEHGAELKPLLITREGIGTIDEGFWSSANPQYALAFLG